MPTRLDADAAKPPLQRAAGRGAHYFDHLRRKLRWQLLVAYVAPLLLLSAYAYWQHSKTVREGIDAHLKSTAENQRNTIDLFLQERVQNLRHAFTPGLLQNHLAIDWDGLLAELQSESAAFVDVGLFGPDGRLVAYAGPFAHLRGTDYTGQPWLQRIRAAERGSYISDVFLGFRGKPHFIVAVRKAGPGGPWVLRASVDPERFADFVGRSRRMADAEAFIVNAQGERQTGAPGPGGSWRMPPRGYEAHVVQTLDRGQQQLRAVAWLEHADWALAVQVPREKAYRPLRTARWGLVAIGLATLVVLVAMVLRSTRKLVAQLQQSDQVQDELRGHLFNAAKLATVGEMAAGVAHEINNPLAIIHEEAGIMRDALDPSLHKPVDLKEFADRLRAIEEATMRGKAITRKLLTFSRQHEPCTEPIDVHALLEHVVSMKQHELDKARIALVREFEPELAPVLGPRNQLEQVVLNLLNNAKDAIGEAGQVTLRTKNNGRFVQIEVEDNGCGMSPEQMEKVFFPFYTTKAVGKGTGLGLSISYGIVKSLGGRIEVTSEQGRGSTFAVLLPRKTVEAQTDASAAGIRGDA